MFKERIKGHPTPRLMQRMSSFDELKEFLNNNSSDDDGCIYFHVPYCDNICSFCAMNRTKLDSELDDYLEFLLSEIEFYKNTKYFKDKPIKSIYFGGGTPTVFKKEHLKRLLSTINESFNLSKDIEYSFESTLHNLSIDKLLLMQELGVNRYSFGVQSFNSNARKFLNRVGDFDYAFKRLSEIKEHFKGTLCCDIIYNYPNQSIDEVLNDAKMVNEVGIDSVSFYSLIYFDKSELAKSIDKDYYDLNVDKSLHDAFLNAMLDYKYKILEHTKLVKNDEYRYIRMTHNAKDILPIGVGAGGNIANFGIFNMNKNMKMVSYKSLRMKEFVKFYNLFQYKKIDLNLALSYLSDECKNEFQDFITTCKNAGYIDELDGFLEFSIDGIFYANSISNEIINICKKDFN